MFSLTGFRKWSTSGLIVSLQDLTENCRNFGNESFKQKLIHLLKIESINMLNIEERVKRKRDTGDTSDIKM